MKKFYIALLLVIMYIPIALVIVYSFNASRLNSVWSGFSLAWYRDLFRDRAIFEALRNSLVLAISSSLSAAVIGTLGAVGMEWNKLRARSSSRIIPLGKPGKIMEYLSILPIMIPEIILGMVLLAFFSLLGLPLGMLTLILAHSCFCIPYVYLLVKARLAGLDKSYTEAARNLGANSWRAFRDIMLPLIMPAVVSGILLSFAMSFDDVIISIFVTGPHTNTLPIRIYTQIKTGVTPKTNALCSLLFVITVLLCILSAAVSRIKPSGNNKEFTMKRKSSVLTVPSTVLIAAILILGISGNAFAGGSKQKRLTLYTWAEMFPQEILDGFEKETGYRVNYVNFDYDETMLTKLERSKGGGYDLVIADDYIIETTIAKGLAQKLDKSKLTNYRNINPIYQKQFYDPLDEYTIPYGAGVQTIVYDPARVRINISGYTDLWDSSLRNSLGIIANHRVINGMALKVLGKSYNTGDLNEIRSAGEKLLSLAPNIRLIKDDGLEDDLLSGEISAGVMYTSQVTLALLEDPDLKVVFPKEGIGFGIMAGFIPSKAPNPEAAYAFLNYIMDPRRGAECFEFLGYYSTYSASDPYISPEFKEFLTLPAGFNIDMEMIQNIPAAAEEEHSRIWTAFKAASGR